MLIPVSDEVVKEYLKLQAVESWRLGNYTRIDERIDKFRYHVADLVLASLEKEINALQGKKITLEKWKG